MPLRPGKLREIDVVARHHVLFDGTVLDVKRLDGFHLFELVLPKTNGFRIGEIFRNAVDHSLASLMGKKVGQNSKSLRVTLGLNRKAPPGNWACEVCHFSDRTDLQIATRSLNDFELPEFF